ncbi:RICIN domain-containing protein [Microbacterium aurum]|mgnify:CR=1 FL=1|jgi:hypothetical protein|uniref:RICIN domain-containing protein n=1 Tax=Microbacterium aurum TaxID=36805 RepID=UPI00248ED757|nr:RICIN domain-containing protein [Microbacterium aurum]
MTFFRPRTAGRRLPLVAGVVAFLLAAGSGTAWAYLTTQLPATASATTAAVAVSQAGFNTPATTKYLPSALSSTRSFTVTNNSAVAGTATVSLSTTGARAASLTLSVWPVASATACTDATAVPATGVTSGTWSSLTLTATLGAGATTTYCARTTIADWRSAADASGTWSVSPVSSVSLSASGWTTTAASLTHTQTVAGFYPLVTSPFFDASLASTWFTIRNASATGLCLDVSGSGGSGTSVLSWSCHLDSNQRWQFVPVNGTDQSLVTLRPRHNRDLRVTTAVPTAGGAAAVTVQTASSALAQQWYVQQVSSGATPVYQLVSAATGRCLPMYTSSSNTQLSTVECDTTAARVVFQREPLTFSSSGTTATVTWGTVPGETMALQRLVNGSWTFVELIGSGSQSESFTPPTGTSTYRIVFGLSGSDVAFGPFGISRNSSTVTAGSGFG